MRRLPLLLLLTGCAATAREDVATEDLQVAPALLDPSYRAQTISVEHPLVLDFPFGGAASNKVSLKLINYPNLESDLFFFHLHSDEKTSRATGENAVRAHGGTFMDMVHSDEKRTVTVKIDGTNFEFDPNRIFTTAGIVANTTPRPQGNALTQIENLAAWIEKNIEIARGQRARPMVTALHNNTDDDTTGTHLSILTEQQAIGQDNKVVNRNPSLDIDDYYIATLEPTYRALVDAYNPNIAERLEHPRDIGYLANWMINQHIEYVNVETQHLHDAENERMVEDLQRLFH